MEARLHHANRVDYCGHVKRDCDLGTTRSRVVELRSPIGSGYTEG